MTATHQPQELTFRRLGANDTAAFDEFFALYWSSMPASERKSRPAMQALVARPDYQVLLLLLDGRLTGYSVTFVPENDTFCLLEYMAVHASFRGGGIGSTLFLHAVEMARNGRGDVAMLLEVDSDREATADREIRRRRQAFYQRLGCLRIEGLDYVLPLDTGHAPPLMDLLILPPPDGAVIRRATLERWLRTIYVTVYGRSPADPRIEQMIARLGDPLQLIGSTEG